jgi:hypothetical protein
MDLVAGYAASNASTAYGWKDIPIHTESCVCYVEMRNIKSEAAKMAEQDDVKTCGICSEPFKNGDVAVQAARWCLTGVSSGFADVWALSQGAPAGVPSEIIERLAVGSNEAPLLREEKFWAHPVCLFSIAREAEGPASRVAAMPPEPPDEGDEAEKRKPK